MKFLNALSLAAIAIAALGSTASVAQDVYPAQGKPVHVLIGYGAGGGTDIAGRLLAAALEEKLGGTFIVENYPGGGGLQALTRVVAAPADGYTLAFVPVPASNMLYLDPDRGGDFTLDDLTPIAMHDYGAIAIAVAVDSPHQTLADLVEAAKSDTSITAASNGALGGGHLALMGLNAAAGININWTAITEPGLLMSSLLGGHIQVVSDSFSELYPAAQNGDIRFLAALSDAPSPETEGVPTAREQGVDLVLTTNRILVGPAGMPQDIVDRLSAAVAEIAADPTYREEASVRAVQINYLDANGAKELWQQFDEDFRPLVDEFRAASQ